MSGPNQVPVPSEHPNHDLLADLAAEVLPDDLAGHVQDHVLACALCAGLLADAESVRSMLLQVEPEQMPDEILVRLERAMLTARREDEAAAAAGDSSETRTLTRMPLGAEAGRADPGRRIGRSGPATGRIAASAATGSMATSGPKTSRLSRMSAPAQSARRQAIEEQKADRPSRFSRLVPMFKIAAVVLVAVGAGAGALQLRGSGGGAADSASTAASGTAPLVAAVQSTKTDYAKKTLPTQVKTLISSSQRALLQGTAGVSADQGGTEAPAPAASASEFAAKSEGAKAPAEPRALAPSGAGQEQGQLLRTPAALQACLTAIGAAGAQPVAVDLARYAGREAAIIVLPADGGGYDVWVVARDCRAGNDGTIDVINNVKP